MRKLISIVTVVVPLCVVIASGCSLNPTEKPLNLEATEFSGEQATASSMVDREELVAADLVSALTQLSEMNPAQVLLEVKNLSNSFDKHVQSALLSAGYRHQSEDSSLQRLSVVTAINPASGATLLASEATAKTYQIKIANVILKRDYLFDRGVIEPVSSMYVKGANATRVRLDESIFDTSVMHDAKAGEQSESPPLPVDRAIANVPIRPASPSAAASAQLPVVTSDTGSVLPLVVHVESAAGSGLSVGDPIRIIVEVGQDSQIHCYYEDSAGTVARLFPNRYRKDSMIKAGETLILPESDRWELSVPIANGTERVMCIAIAFEGIETKPLLPDLLPIVATDLDEILKRYEAVAGTELINRKVNIAVN